MRLQHLLDTSIFVGFLKGLGCWTDNCIKTPSYLFQSSQTSRSTKEFWARLKIYCRYSFLGIISEPSGGASSVSLDNSRVAQALLKFYRLRIDQLRRQLRESATVESLQEAKEQLYLSPLNILGIVIVAAIIANLGLYLVFPLPSSVVFTREIGWWGWLARGLFLLIGIGGLFCRADWPAIRKESLFLRKVKRVGQED